MNLIEETNYDFAPKVKGKVRDIYDIGDRLVFITTDRQSGFDRHLAYIPYKGAVLNLASKYWFEQLSPIIKNHMISVPHPNVMVGKKLEIIPVEFVMRGYLTGITDTSIWTAYNKGDRDFCGNKLPDGMEKK